MKFNEKLIELRKKKGLSQEELGYEFNVTRQTISKWELGQTTPEMDKLVEISKYFNVTVDDLINNQEDSTTEENVNYEATTNNTDDVVVEEAKAEEKNNKDYNQKRIIAIIVVVVLILVILGGSILSLVTKKVVNDTFGNANQQIEQNANGVFSIFNKVINLLNRELDNQLEGTDDIQNQIKDDLDTQDENIQKVEDIFNQAQNKIEVESFNGSFELFEGMEKGVQVKTLLSKVISNNRKDTNIITVIYQNQNTTDVEQIKTIREGLEDFNEYEVYFGYDEQGYINEVNIEI